MGWRSRPRKSTCFTYGFVRIGATLCLLQRWDRHADKHEIVDPAPRYTPPLCICNSPWKRNEEQDLHHPLALDSRRGFGPLFSASRLFVEHDLALDGNEKPTDPVAQTQQPLSRVDNKRKLHELQCCFKAV
jgi:hypothetical protein